MKTVSEHKKSSMLTTVVTYIVSRSMELKNKYADAFAAPVEFACIFCHSEEEYQRLTHSIQTLGKIAETTPSGFTYLLDKPIETAIQTTKCFSANI